MKVLRYLLLISLGILLFNCDDEEGIEGTAFIKSTGSVNIKIVDKGVAVSGAKVKLVDKAGLSSFESYLINIADSGATDVNGLMTSGELPESIYNISIEIPEKDRTQVFYSAIRVTSELVNEKLIDLDDVRGELKVTIRNTGEKKLDSTAGVFFNQFEGLLSNKQSMFYVFDSNVFNYFSLGSYFSGVSFTNADRDSIINLYALDSIIIEQGVGVYRKKMLGSTSFNYAYVYKVPTIGSYLTSSFRINYKEESEINIFPRFISSNGVSNSLIDTEWEAVSTKEGFSGSQVDNFISSFSFVASEQKPRNEFDNPSAVIGTKYTTNSGFTSFALGEGNLRLDFEEDTNQYLLSLNSFTGRFYDAKGEIYVINGFDVKGENLELHYRLTTGSYTTVFQRK